MDHLPIVCRFYTLELPYTNNLQHLVGIEDIPMEEDSHSFQPQLHIPQAGAQSQTSEWGPDMQNSQETEEGLQNAPFPIQSANTFVAVAQQALAHVMQAPYADVDGLCKRRIVSSSKAIANIYTRDEGICPTTLY